MESKLQLKNLAIHGVVFLEADGDRILNIFEHAREAELPKELDSQIVNIPEDSPESSALILSDGLPNQSMIPQGSVELIALSVDEDGDVTLSIDLSPDCLDAGIDVIEKILSLEEIHISDFEAKYEVNEEFDKLDLSIDGPPEIDFTGVKFASGEHNYILQAEDASTWEEPDEEAVLRSDQAEKEETEDEEDDFISATIMAASHFDVEESGEFINDRIEDIDETLELVIP